MKICQKSIAVLLIATMLAPSLAQAQEEPVVKKTLPTRGVALPNITLTSVQVDTHAFVHFTLTGGAGPNDPHILHSASLNQGRLTTTGAVPAPRFLVAAMLLQLMFTSVFI